MKVKFESMSILLINDDANFHSKRKVHQIKPFFFLLMLRQTSV